MNKTYEIFGSQQERTVKAFTNTVCFPSSGTIVDDYRRSDTLIINSQNFIRVYGALRVCERNTHNKWQIWKYSFLTNRSHTWQTCNKHFACLPTKWTQQYGYETWYLSQDILSIFTSRKQLFKDSVIRRRNSKMCRHTLCTYIGGETYWFNNVVWPNCKQN